MVCNSGVLAACAAALFLTRPTASQPLDDLPLSTAVANVTTAGELRGAILGGFQHVLVTEHLDLSSEPTPRLSAAAGDNQRALFTGLPDLKSLRVRLLLA